MGGWKREILIPPGKMCISRSHIGFSVRAVDSLGVRIHDITLDEAVAICRAAIRADRPLQIVTPNAEFVMAAREDDRFRETLNASSLAIPDGIASDDAFNVSRKRSSSDRKSTRLNS